MASRSPTPASVGILRCGCWMNWRPLFGRVGGARATTPSPRARGFTCWTSRLLLGRRGRGGRRQRGQVGLDRGQPGVVDLGLGEFGDGADAHLLDRIQAVIGE